MMDAAVCVGLNAEDSRRSDRPFERVVEVDTRWSAPTVQRFSILVLGAVAFGAMLWALPVVAADADQRVRPNVLFIGVDDLRPELGCYGEEQIESPRIDRLAERGTVFLRAYCQQAICGASRTSVLTGLRPDTTGVWGNRTHFRQRLPDAVTLPQHFKNHGYHAQGMGKIFHGRPETLDPQSWSVPCWFGGPRYYYTPEGIASARGDYQRITGKSGAALDEWVNHFCRGLATEAPKVADDVPYDGQLAGHAMEALRALQETDQPFFLAVGFLKPHLPFVAPKRYWDLYDPEKIRLADNPDQPQGAPGAAMHGFEELRYYSDIAKKGPIGDEKARRLIHGYYACVSYVDAQIGQVLDELDRLGLRDRTIVCLWGDHGWHLGDHGLWCKHTNFESATRAPLIVSAPGAKAPGGKTNALVEFVDIFPTLAELAGLPIPESLAGTSRAALLDDPNGAGVEAAMSQYPRGKVMGYSMRTDRYRFTEWTKPSGPPVGVELYDHYEDPGENVNVADRPEHKDLVARLSQQLHAATNAGKTLGH